MNNILGTSPTDVKISFETYWEKLIASKYSEQDQIGEVIAYAARGGGKRVRPLLCLMICESLGTQLKDALPLAAAIEMIHTYSLVHDDLPCMDDDDMRRGRASTHKAYAEERALLAGDGLLTDAFEIIAASGLNANARASAVLELAKAAGGSGMVRGQALDLHWTKRQGASKSDLDEIHLLKTGYLIGAACALGAIAAQANKETISGLRTYGHNLGLAFQITDDLIDQTDGTGKTAGKDKEAGKLTYLAMMNKAEAKYAAALKTEEAINLLTTHIQQPEILIKFSTRLLERDS